MKATVTRKAFVNALTHDDPAGLDQDQPCDDPDWEPEPELTLCVDAEYDRLTRACTLVNHRVNDIERTDSNAYLASLAHALTTIFHDISLYTGPRKDELVQHLADVQQNFNEHAQAWLDAQLSIDETDETLEQGSAPAPDPREQEPPMTAPTTITYSVHVSLSIIVPHPAHALHRVHSVYTMGITAATLWITTAILWITRTPGRLHTLLMTLVCLILSTVECTLLHTAQTTASMALALHDQRVSLAPPRDPVAVAQRGTLSLRVRRWWEAWTKQGQPIGGVGVDRGGSRAAAPLPSPAPPTAPSVEPALVPAQPALVPPRPSYALPELIDDLDSEDGEDEHGQHTAPRRRAPRLRTLFAEVEAALQQWATPLSLSLSHSAAAAGLR